MPFEGLDKSITDLISQKHIEDKVSVKQDMSKLEVMFTDSSFFQSGSAELSEQSRDLVSNIVDIIYLKAMFRSRTLTSSPL